MKKTIRLTESDLHKVVSESVKRILREFDEPYDWEGLDDYRKDFENHLSWRNKEEVDANDRVATNPLYYTNKDDYDRMSRMIDADSTSKPDARMCWDWGYKNGRGTDDPVDLSLSDFDRADDEFMNPYDPECFHDFALRDEFWPEQNNESRLRGIVREAVRRELRRR